MLVHRPLSYILQAKVNLHTVILPSLPLCSFFRNITKRTDDRVIYILCEQKRHALTKNVCHGAKNVLNGKTLLVRRTSISQA